MNSLSEKTQPTSIPKRFIPGSGVLVIDRFMNQFIKIGGTGVIVAVLGIFVFITWQILPLFQSAQVKRDTTVELKITQPLVGMGADEWSELPFVVDQTGAVYFADAHGNRGVWKAGSVLPQGVKITSFEYMQHDQIAAYGTNDGRFGTAKIDYEPEFEGDVRMISGKVTSEDLIALGEGTGEVTDITLGMTEARTVIAGIRSTPQGKKINILTLERSHSLMGDGQLEITGKYDITSQVEGTPEKIIVNMAAEELVVTNTAGKVFYFRTMGSDVEFKQAFTPFEGSKSAHVHSVGFLFGGVSLVLTNDSGENRVFSLYRKDGEEERLFYPIKHFDPIPTGADVYAFSLRNKAFLLAAGKFASLRYSTTQDIRWQMELPFAVRGAVISGKYDKLVFLDDQNRLQLYHLNDPHPEAGIKAYFSKIWYEGYSEPSYDWQSTGGTDEFEPKLSLVPLVIGSLKGTFYALLFAFPIALLAAIYTSQFAHARFKNTVKPLMEVMASLPSVVLGFLAALWLAPLIEDKVPSLLMIFIFLPVISVATGFLVSALPRKYVAWLKPGYEFIVLIPIVIAGSIVLWQAGPALEALMFGGDFRHWWTDVLGLKFEQRNSLVVGFVMGFAVIPIIFTITEDALSNVAPSLRSASLAMGASRWQTAMRVVIPSASAGILSAIMIGFGRAVGETMIVVMATGNTPIMDMNIFSGMRTLSANIAVELPEAPFHGTLYRTLFLGALALFMMTFFINTIAEVLREKLRAKYKTV